MFSSAILVSFFAVGQCEGAYTAERCEEIEKNTCGDDKECETYKDFCGTTEEDELHIGKWMDGNCEKSCCEKRKADMQQRLQEAEAEKKKKEQAEAEKKKKGSFGCEKMNAHYCKNPQNVIECKDECEDILADKEIDKCGNKDVNLCGTDNERPVCKDWCAVDARNKALQQEFAEFRRMHKEKAEAEKKEKADASLKQRSFLAIDRE